jgi:hypothetical protein
VLQTGTGEAKFEGKAQLLSSAAADAVFQVPLKGLPEGTTVRITYTITPLSGAAEPGLVVEERRASRGASVSGTKPVTGTVVATLPDGEGAFSLTLQPSSKVRVDALRAERLK